MVCSLTRAIDAVIKAKGIVVADLVIRSGRRGRRLDGTDTELTKKPRARQRMATLKAKPVHPDNAATYAAFFDRDRDVAGELEPDASDE